MKIRISLFLLLVITVIGLSFDAHAVGSKPMDKNQDSVDLQYQDTPGKRGVGGLNPDKVYPATENISPAPLPKNPHAESKNSTTSK